MKHQYRVILSIKDDIHPTKDVGWCAAFPAHKTLTKAIVEFKALQKAIDNFKLEQLEQREKNLLMKEVLS